MSDYISEEEWIETVQQYIYEVLAPIIPDEDDRVKYVSETSMVEWIQSLTHETFDPEFNYEDQEYDGDLVLKWGFPKYLKIRFPHLHKDELTELYTAYMSKMEQAKLAIELGLDKLARVKGIDVVILNIATDLFEAFFGALERVADSITPGIGTSICFNMIVHIFSTRTIDESLAQGASKTQINQIFERFQLGNPESSSSDKRTTYVTINLKNNSIAQPPTFRKKKEPYTIIGSAFGQDTKKTKKTVACRSYEQAIEFLKDNGIVTVERDEEEATGSGMVNFEVRLTPKQMNFLKRKGINLTSDLIGTGTASTKKGAEVEAYAAAQSFLARRGITREWAKNIKIAQDLSDPTLRPYIQQASDKLQREGYDYMFFQIPGKTSTKTGAVVLLIGVSIDEEDNEHKRLLSFAYGTDRSNSYKAAKVEAVRKYITGSN